ncbi:MAG: flagellar basal body rod protein FlgB [Alphaproteobacteria bacterium]|nr:flagellar basal body rod protein FlgB [Alphaproteobacteria bacterium]
MDWLALRQSVVASNVANANTPGYRAKEVRPFEDTMEMTSLDLVRTSQLHMAPVQGGSTDFRLRAAEGWDRSLSNNDVTIEAELIKAGESSRMMALDTGLTRMFHRMVLSSLKVSA